MIKLQLLLGSASYGLTTENSDIDICIVGSGVHPIPNYNKVDVFHQSKEDFVQDILLERKKHPLLLQRLFPAEIMLDTEASKYIIDTRESVIKAQLKKIYEVHMKIGNIFTKNIDRTYHLFPKRLAYGIMFFDTMYRYAQGIPFAEAIRPEEDFRQWLLDVRNGTIDLEEIKSVCEEKKEKAESVSSFYDCDVNQDYLDTWKSYVLSLLSE